MAWFVDNTHICLKPGALKSSIEVDERATASFGNTVEGRFVVPWRGREVELVRFRVGNSAETELWVDGVRVPASEAAPIVGKSRPCAAHDKRTKRSCPVCEAATCRRCAAVDGVRCQSCFDDAVTSEEQQRKRGWLIGAGVMLLFAVALFYAGASDPSAPFGKFGGAALFGAAFMVYTAFKARRSPESVVVGALQFALSDAEPFLAGAACGRCDERVASAKQGMQCAACEKVLHTKCRDGHKCRAAKTGPDWPRLGAASNAA
jgi:hypothetical protein